MWNLKEHFRINYIGYNSLHYLWLFYALFWITVHGLVAAVGRKEYLLHDAARLEYRFYENVAQ